MPSEAPTGRGRVRAQQTRKTVAGGSGRAGRCRGHALLPGATPLSPTTPPAPASGHHRTVWRACSSGRGWSTATVTSTAGPTAACPRLSARIGFRQWGARLNGRWRSGCGTTPGTQDTTTQPAHRPGITLHLSSMNNYIILSVFSRSSDSRSPFLTGRRRAAAGSPRDREELQVYSGEYETPHCAQLSRADTIWETKLDQGGNTSAQPPNILPIA